MFSKDDSEAAGGSTARQYTSVMPLNLLKAKSSTDVMVLGRMISDIWLNNSNALWPMPVTV